MLRRFNPFRRRSILIRKMPGGWEPWNNRQPPRRMSWRPLMMGCGGLFFLCGGMMVMLMMVTSSGDVSATPTLDLTNIIQEYIDNRTPTPELNEANVVSSRFDRSSPSPTITRTAVSTHTLTPSATYTPSTTLTAAQTLAPLTGTWIPGQQPTYTPYPTYTPQPVEYREWVITSPPVYVEIPGSVIRETQVVVIEVPVTVVRNVPVTATPHPLRTKVPMTDEPIYVQPCVPVFGMTSTGGQNAHCP